MNIKFYNYYIRNVTTGARCKVRYSLDNHTSQRPCVIIRTANILENMFAVLGDYCEVIDRTDIMTDYHENQTVYLFDDHPLYSAARKRAEHVKYLDDVRWAKKLGKPAPQKPSSMSNDKEAKTMNKQPKVMNSRYQGQCDKCGRIIRKDESILWIERGVVECCDCYPQNPIYSALHQTETPAQAPSKRPSGDKWADALSWDTNTAPEPVAAKPHNLNVVADVPAPNPRPIAKPVPTHAVDALPSLDVPSQLVCDLMVTLVNAIDRLDGDQLQAIHMHALDFARNSASESRARLWRDAAGLTE